MGSPTQRARLIVKMHQAISPALDTTIMVIPDRRSLPLGRQAKREFSQHHRRNHSWATTDWPAF